jgi:hypothetical protein
MSLRTPATSYEECLREFEILANKYRLHARIVCAADYSERQLEEDFLGDFWMALGWDVKNDKNLIGPHREVQLESPMKDEAKHRRIDYLFRADKVKRFICEAKRPANGLKDKDVFQAKRYAWVKDVPLAILTCIAETKIFLVGGEPNLKQPDTGFCFSFRHDQLVQNARQIWDLLSRQAVGAGSVDAYIASQSPHIITLAPKQAWIFRPDRSQSLDAKFLALLDEARKRFAKSLIANNPKAHLDEDSRLNAAVQRIIDRLVFLRICEDRDIDIGTVLATLVQTWENKTHAKKNKDPLYATLVRHFRYLNRNPASNAPYFNGQLFKDHFSEDLIVDDETMYWFLDRLTSDESPYLFSDIPAEILGSIYERFIGKVIEIGPDGIPDTKDSPSVRKAGGVFYTPGYVVEHLVEQTVGVMLKDKPLDQVRKLRFLDPACGSGSFLIRVYERIIEHYLTELQSLPTKNKVRRAMTYADRQGTLHLTTEVKKQILLDNIYGVDIDPQAIEVTQLSLYLTLLEGETRNTLHQQKEAVLEDNPTPILPTLTDNIQHGNTIVQNDPSLPVSEVTRLVVREMDAMFPDVMAAGGFDAEIGNPPYIPIEKMSEWERAYYLKRYPALQGKFDSSVIFILRGMELLRNHGRLGYISSVAWQTGENYGGVRKETLTNGGLVEVINLPFDTFPDAYVDVGLFVLCKQKQDSYGIYRFPQHTRISALGEICMRRVPSSLLCAPAYKIVLDPVAHGILNRVMASSATLGDLTDSTQGLAATRFTASSKKIGASWMRFDPKAEVHRYSFVRHTNQYANMALFGSLRRFYSAQPKLLIRRLINRQDKLDIGYTDEECVFKKDINPFVVTTAQVSPYYLLGLMSSKLLSYLYVNTSAIATKDDFRQTTLAELRRIPIVFPDRSTKDGKAAYTTITKNAEAIETLTKQVRATSPDSSQIITLQGSIAAFERQIDVTVYRLYDLTDAEVIAVNAYYQKE